MQISCFQCQWIPRLPTARFQMLFQAVESGYCLQFCAWPFHYCLSLYPNNSSQRIRSLCPGHAHFKPGSLGRPENPGMTAANSDRRFYQYFLCFLHPDSGSLETPSQVRPQLRSHYVLPGKLIGRVWSTFFQEKWPELSGFPLHISTKSGGWGVLALNLHSSQGLHEDIHWDFFGMNFPVSQHYQKHAVPNLWHQWRPCFLIVGSEPHHDLNNKARPISIDFVPGTSHIVTYFICKTVLLRRCYNSTLVVTEEPDTGLLFCFCFLGFFFGGGGACIFYFACGAS